jgi:hypothetical protein
MKGGDRWLRGTCSLVYYRQNLEVMSEMLSTLNFYIKKIKKGHRVHVGNTLCLDVQLVIKHEF